MLFEKEASLLPAGAERRTMRRFDIRLPALVKLSGNGFQEVLTETQNVSARGVFFYVDRPVAPGSKVEITLTLPSHITLTEAVRVRFRARVLRVEANNGPARMGVAALIEEYEFLRSMVSQKYFSTAAK
jgi:hypothetical protein